MQQTWTRVGGLVLGACLALAGHTAPAHAAGVPVADAATKQVAQVKVEIRQESGHVAKNTADLEWNEDGTFSFEDAEHHQHQLDVKLVRPHDKSSKVSITVAYTRDGRAIIAPYTVETTVKKREVIRIEGGLAMALTVTPKKVKTAPPKDERPDFDPGEGDDPLAGLD